MLYDRQVSSSSFSDAAGITACKGDAARDVLALLEARVGLGHWRVLPMGQVLTLSNRAAKILHIRDGASGLNLKEMLDCFVPADCKTFRDLIENCVNQKCGFEAILRLYCQGEVKLVEIYCDVVVDEGGTLRELVGTLRDITARAKRHTVSQGRAAIMRVLMHNIPSAVAVLDKNMVYLSASDHWAAGHGFNSVDEMLGKNHYELFPQAKAFQSEHQQVLGGEVLRRKRAFLKDSEGKPIEQTCVMCPWKTSARVVGGMIIMLGTVDIKKTLKFANVDSEDQPDNLLELLEQVD